MPPRKRRPDAALLAVLALTCSMLLGAVPAQATTPEPTGITLSNITDTSAVATWDAVPNNQGYEVFADGVRTNISTDENSQIGNLSACTDYSIQVRVKLNDRWSELSPSTPLKTSGCPTATTAPTAPVISGITASNAVATWNYVSGATSYEVYTNGLKTNTSTDNTSNLALLNACTDYKVQVRAYKFPAWSTLSPVATFKTAGCPAPAPAPAPAPTPEPTPTPTPTPTSTSGTSGTAAAPAPAPAPSAEGTTAAKTFGWGPVIKGDEFNYVGRPDEAKWRLYDHNGFRGQGVPAAWNVNGSVARVSGDAYGNTGGMMARYSWGDTYYRVETRMRTSVRDPEYHPVLILWPNEDWGAKCPEFDYAEGVQNTDEVLFSIHYPECDTGTYLTKKLDMTQWHNYAVEWGPGYVVAYIDGQKWFEDRNPAHIFNGPMHQCMQLDWFQEHSAATNPKPSWMEVDWTRTYAIS